jgi:hypothetical protein
MLRNIHFFNLKEGTDEGRMHDLMDEKLAEYAAQFGRIEHKTWKLLDAHAHGQPVEAATYMNESLWPSQKEAAAFSRAERPPEVREWWDEMLNGGEVVLTVRYGDEGG